MRRILLAITGSIAAYKAAELTRYLVKDGYDVEVAMSDSACEFISPLTFQTLSGKSVIRSMFGDSNINALNHIDLSRRADLILIVPASADMIAKVANGICDDLISAVVSARNCPLAIAPAMNSQMWLNPANQRNIEQLRADGVSIFGPEYGAQACGEFGSGCLLDPISIVDLLGGIWQEKTLSGKHVLITAGPTFEVIDPVRRLTNLSSGKMGYALAKSCRDAGAKVTMISGPTALKVPAEISITKVETAKEMFDAVIEQVKGKDIFISVAAVADYRVTQASSAKLKKGKQPLTLTLEENDDILLAVSNLDNAPFCVGFALESEQLLAFAETKRLKKRLPLLVANLVQDSQGTDTTKVVLLDDDGQHSLQSDLKREVAKKITSHIAKLLAEA